MRLPIGEPHPALMVRETAMVTDQGRKTVFVLKEKKDKEGKPVTVKGPKGEQQPLYVATPRDVGEVGVLRDGYREVEKGIEPGDLVVVAGMQRLRPGIDVLAEKMPSAGAAATPTKETAGHATAGDAESTKGTARPAAPSQDGQGSPAAAPDRAADATAAKPAPTGDSWRTASPAPAGKGAGRSGQGSRPGRTGR